MYWMTNRELIKACQQLKISQLHLKELNILTEYKIEALQQQTSP